MRSKVLLVASTVMIAITASIAGAQAAPKIGFVDSRAILSQAPGRAEAEAQFDKEMGSYRAQVQRMEDSLRTMITAFEKDAAKLDSAGRISRTRAIQTREEDYQKRAQALQGEMQNRQENLVKPILEQINKILEDIRAQESYAIIFDVGAQGSPIVAADKSLDLTEKVIARLKAAPAARPAGAAQQPAGVTRPKS